MTTIQVKASRSYEVKIGRGLLSSLGTEAAGLIQGRKAAIVSDSNVAPLYLEKVTASLEGAGFRTCSFVFPAKPTHAFEFAAPTLGNFLRNSRHNLGFCYLVTELESKLL